MELLHLRMRQFFVVKNLISFKIAIIDWSSEKILKKSINNVKSNFRFLADIAIAYTISIDNRDRFDANRFIRDFGGIRVDELTFAVQTLATYRDERPKPQPLEVLQLILRLWEWVLLY